MLSLLKVLFMEVISLGVICVDILQSNLIGDLV